jgi:hypothetical protein
MVSERLCWASRVYWTEKGSKKYFFAFEDIGVEESQGERKRGEKGQIEIEVLAIDIFISHQRNVSGEGHLKGKIPPPKKRIREFGYRFILILPYKSIAKHSSHL